MSQTSEFTTLQTDGPTKFGKHYATYDINNAVFSYSLGVLHVLSGSAKNTLETFEEILDNIDCAQQALIKDAASSKIVAKSKNTMSERPPSKIVAKSKNTMSERHSAEIVLMS